MSLSAYYLDPQIELRSGLNIEEIRATLASGGGLLWIDIEDPDEIERAILLDDLKFHPLVVEIAVDPDTHPARVEDFGSYLFVNARSVDYTTESDVVETTDLAIFIGESYVVTVHSVKMPSVEAIKQMVELEGRPLMKGAGFFAHHHFDALIQAILPTLDRMDNRADAIEEQILENPDHTALIALTQLKRSCLSLNRALIPQREVLSRLGRREFELIGNGVDIYYRDLLDDLVRVQSANDNIRERADTSLATYLSVVANRQNEIMKVLSIVATVFLPLGLIAGLFGMNFENMPGLGYRYGYHIVLGASLFALALISWMFWLKRWAIRGAGFFRPRRLTRFVPNAVDPTRLAGHLGRTVSKNLRRTESVVVRETAHAARWGPAVFQRINPAHRRRESENQQPSSE